MASSGDVTIESLHDEGATALCCARHDVRVVLNPDTDEFGRDLAGFLDAHRDCLAG